MLLSMLVICLFIISITLADTPSLELVLTKESIGTEESIDGYLNITFTEPFSPSTILKADFNGGSSEVVLKDYLKAKNISYEETQTSYSTSAPATLKPINFEATGYKQFAFKLPNSAEVKNFTMTVTGSAEASPKFVTIDMEDVTGKNEWKYFGDFLSYASDFTYPSSLTISSEGDPTILGGTSGSNLTYLCEAIQLPESKHFKIGAKIKKAADSTADLRAVILSFTDGYAAGGADSCDMSEPGQTATWQTCEINFPTSKQGIYLICVYYLGSDDKVHYELSRDTTNSSSRYDCPITSGMESECFPSFSKDYFIGVKTAGYGGILGKSATWAEGVTDQQMEYSLTQFLASCKGDEVGDCTIPFKVGSGSAGTLQLSNLKIDYTEAGGSPSYSNKIYDLTEIAGQVYKLGDVILTNGTKNIQVSLKEFNITTPVITEPSKTFYLETSITPGVKVAKPIKIFTAGEAPDTGDVESKITAAKDKITAIKKDYAEELALFDINIDTSQIASLESEISIIKSNTSLSPEESQNKLSELSEKIDAYIKEQPKSFYADSAFKDLYLPEPADVESVVVEEPETAYLYQSNIEVGAEVSNYVLEKNNGDKQKFSLITKTITPKKTLSNVYVYEKIPKTLAENVADIIFKDKSYEVIEQDPVVRYKFASLSQPVTITYGVKGVTVTQNMLASIGSILVSSSPEEVIDKPKPNECPNKICERPYEDETICPEDCPKKTIPWFLIIILVVFLLAGVVYINFYRGKGSFRKLVEKSPFTNAQDLKNVKDYISAAQNKDLKNPDIAQALLKSGWSKEQVVYAFEDLKWDEKRLFTINFAPLGKESTKKLETFIKKCLQLNIPRDKIKHVLLQKGWAPEKVDAALKKIGEPAERIETVKEKEKKISFYFEKSLEEELKK